MNTPLIIQTEKNPVTLRQLVVEDAPFYFAAVDANRDHLSQFGDETATKYPDLESVKASLLNPSSPSKLRMGIWDEDTFVGSINLTPSDDNNAAELGYWLDSRHTGKGYATVATRALATHAKQQRYHRVFANVTAGNEASAAVLKRVGFVQMARRAGNLAFELANRVPDASYESSHALETITNREQFLTAENVRAFRKQHASNFTSQRADRAFGILINPNRGSALSQRRNHYRAEDLGLIVKKREEVGLPLPARDSLVSNINVVQVGSFLDFVDIHMSEVSLWGLNKDTRLFISQLAEHLKTQLELQMETDAQN